MEPIAETSSARPSTPIKNEVEDANISKTHSDPVVADLKLLRCADWLQKQRIQVPEKLSLQNKNLHDIQFIMETNAARRNFLLSKTEDDTTVPPAVDEVRIEPKEVPIKKLRLENLQLECDWRDCQYFTNNYDDYQRHVHGHALELHVINCDGVDNYLCLWDICGHKTSDRYELFRHVNYHGYHSKLMAVGFNGRATLKLVSCKKDSSKRNVLPVLESEHSCLWAGCDEKFNSIQVFYDHVKEHVLYSDKLCSWAGCGAKFPRKVTLATHVRSHTGEKVIACYHCGQQFVNNRKLADHLRRQNAYPNSGYTCEMCGKSFATDYLLREHFRQHVSVYACTQCDMSAPSLTSLASHIRYKHMGADSRLHPCPECPYRAVTKWDLRKHMPIHNRKRKRRDSIKQECDSDKDISDEENEICEKKKPKVVRKYACHICSGHKFFTRGWRLTTHLVKVHGAQWPFGHSRFRYQISEDGLYRVTTTRIESLEVSKKIVDGTSVARTSIDKDLKFSLIEKSDATDKKPKHLEVAIKEVNEESQVEITMCDIDEAGNIISSEVIKSDVLYTD